MNDFDAALEHAAKAEDDAYNKAGDEIDKGNAELKKSIEEYTDGHMERAESHFDSSDGGACSYLSHMSIYSSGHHFQKRSLDSGHFGYFLSNILVVRCCASPNVSGHA